MRITPIAGIPLVLGGNVFGWTAEGDEGFAVLDAFYEAGGQDDRHGRCLFGLDPRATRAANPRAISASGSPIRGVREEMRIHTKTGM